MARPKRQTVDYFPHFCKSGRTIFILEGLYGNDGYAFWYKLLETLGESEGHCYDCSTTSNWSFLISRARVSDERAREIIATLVELGKIDAELWNEHSVIWVPRFVENLTDLYRKRATGIPDKPSFRGENYTKTGVSAEKTTPKWGFPRNLSAKDSIVKERIEKDSRLLPAHTCEAVVDAWNTILGDHLPKVQTLTDGRKEALKARLEELSSDMDEAVGMLTEAFEKVKQSTFLLGDNDRGWSATFDWVIQSADKLAKIIEGVYDDHGTNRKATNSDIALGVDEWIESGTGRRTYGTGATTIPTDAPPRPSARHQWDAASGLWILI